KAEGDANDAVGGHNGTLKNGATFATGEVGQAFSFDGSDDYAEVPDSPAWALGSHDFTLEMWINLNQVDGSSIGNPSDVFIGNDEGGGSQNKWFFALGGGKLNFHVNDTSGNSQFLAQADFSPTVGQWYHVAVTRSGSNFTTYIDGAVGATE